MRGGFLESSPSEGKLISHELFARGEDYAGDQLWRWNECFHMQIANNSGQGLICGGGGIRVMLNASSQKFGIFLSFDGINWLNFSNRLSALLAHILIGHTYIFVDFYPMMGILTLRVMLSASSAKNQGIRYLTEWKHLQYICSFFTWNRMTFPIDLVPFSHRFW